MYYTLGENILAMASRAEDIMAKKQGKYLYMCVNKRK
jgi:hypothetical protein